MRTISLLICSVTFIMLGMAYAEDTGNIDVKAILEKLDEAEGFKSNYSEMKQIITTSGGQERALVIRSWSVNNGDKQLAEYLSPPDIKGQRILMTDDGDNIWMFNPETRRTRKLGSHMKKKKVMGSDFSYEDQSGGKASEEYTGKFLRSEKLGKTECYVLELKPTPKGPSYGKLIAWIGKEDYITRQIDYFRKDESKPFKRLAMEDIRESGEKLYPYKMTMTNLEDETKTINIVTRTQFGMEIPLSIFESRNLGK
ncbi:outer membrane lipoprotein-sorting protein [Candidatus Poribacteria bacterium]